MLSTYVSYQTITRDIAKSLDRVEKQPVVERESAYYLENIVKVKSIDDFVGNDRLYRYAMKAFGLEDMTYAKAFIKKALTEGIDSNDAFANKLSDTRYRDFVETFNFVRHGEATTAFDRTQQGTVDKYVRQTLEQDAGAQNEGVRLALYFERKASGIGSVLEILADPALSKVVRTALSLPDATATIDIDKQVELISKRFNVEDLKDPEGLAKFMRQFTSLWEVANPTASPMSQLSAIFSQPTEYGISTDLMMTIQQLRR